MKTNTTTHAGHTLKSILLLVVFLVVNTLNAADQQVKYPDSWGKSGYTLVQQEKGGVMINYSVEGFNLTDALIDGETMQNIELFGHFLQNNEGAPNLPGMGRYIAVPEGATPVLKIVSFRTELYNDVNMAPAPRIPFENEDGPLTYKKNSRLYSTDAFYPALPVKLSGVEQIRGVDAVMVGVTPFQYNAVTKELIVYRDIKIEVSFEGGSGYFGEDRLRSRWWDPIMNDMFLNHESLPKINYNKSYQGVSDEEGAEYLIIIPTNPEFAQWADSIKAFRTLQGISTKIVNLTEVGGNTATIIENYVNNAYNTWTTPPAAVLIMADYGTNATNSVTSPIWDSYCVSDNIYADVDGNSMPDMIFARLTANNAAQLQVMCTKFLNYERNPPTSPDFYDHPITALGWQTERWFQICSEVVGGYLKNAKGKNPVRINAIYSGTPGSVWSTATNTATVVNFFGPSGLGYIPATPAELGGWSGGTPTMVNNALNAGSFMLQHRDHGFEQGWGEPAYQSSHINSLTNTDLSFIWSVNCLTGKYNYSSEVFAEKFHRYTYNGNNSGALGVIAASEVSYSFVNDTYVWGAYDNMWPDFMPTYGTIPDSRGELPAFANAAGKYFLQQSAWPYNTNNKEVTYNLFHHHGDAFLTVFSEVPQNLTVNHMPVLYAGMTSFDVTANEGSLIALTVDGEIIGTAAGTGAPVSITIPAQTPPDQMIVTVTLQNYYRYSATVDVVPASGPYIVQFSNSINDAGGNNNGQIDFDEAILLTVGVKNVGIQVANNVIVNISTPDTYITITDATENYGNIAPDQVVSITDGFAFDVADNIPDGHSFLVEVSATDGTNTWTSSFSLIAHAPDFTFSALSIYDPSGNNNGKLDPGENANLTIEITNDGSAEALDITSLLSSASPYIVINTSTVNIASLAPGASANATFEISVEAGTPLGTPVTLINDVTTGAYSFQETYTTVVGLIVEDWETGDMTQFAWQTGGNGNWTVANSTPYEGTYCAKSADISDNQSTWLTLTYDVASADNISFWFKVSSESNYDYLEFYIDNVLKEEWSGEVGYQEATYPVTAGTHTFKWQYSKDVSVSTGDDCGRVDYIVLPAQETLTAFAGPDAAICEGNTHQCAGMASNYTTLEWSTAGDGTFSSTTILDPVYTPGTNDIAAGSVILTLTATDGSQNLEDHMTLTINEGAQVFAGDDGAVCSDGSYVLAGATAANYSDIEWTTSGDGSFSDNSILNPEYTPGTNDITSGTVTLTLTAAGLGTCSDVTDQVALTINAAATAVAGVDGEICESETFTLANATATNYSSIAWTTSGDGTFDNATTMNPVYTPGSNDVAGGSATLTITASGNTGCPAVSHGIILTIVQAPEAFAGEDGTTGEGTPYTLSGATALNYTSLLWTTAGDGTFDDASLLNPTYTPGTNDAANQSVVLTLTATGNALCGTFTDEMTLNITLGFNENMLMNGVRIYPNPSDGNFVIELNSTSEVTASMIITSAVGETVVNLGEITVNGNRKINMNSSLEPGIYYLRIQGNDFEISRKIMVK